VEWLQALPRLSGAQALLGVLVLVSLWALYRAQRNSGKHGYDIRDMMMDAATSKASLNAHIIAAMAVMAIYVCVVRANRNEDPTNLVVSVLGIFVLGRVAAQGISAFKPPEAGGTKQITEHTERTETIEPSAPAPPAAPVNPLMKGKAKGGK
jgi:hypothetical protein